MACLTFQNFIFFSGIWTPQTRFSSNVVYMFQKSLNVWKDICLEAKHVGAHGPIEKEICHLKAKKNKLNYYITINRQHFRQWFQSIAYFVIFYDLGFFPLNICY